MDAEKRALVMVLRSLINSRQDSNVKNLSSDYRETEGCNIPFQRFGHQSLASFLSSTGEFKVLANQNIIAKASGDSDHIKKLVAEQNSKKKRRVAPAQRFLPLNRHVRKAYEMQQSVYSNAYAQMKNRSVTSNNPLNNRPAQPNRTVPAPLHNDRPKYVITFEAGMQMQPANALARSAVSISQPQLPPIEHVFTATEKKGQNRNSAQAETIGRLQQQVRQNQPIQEPAQSQSSVPNKSVIPAPAQILTSQPVMNEVCSNSKLLSRLQRFNSVPSQMKISKRIAPLKIPDEPIAKVAVEKVAPKQTSELFIHSNLTRRLRRFDSTPLNDSAQVQHPVQPTSCPSFLSSKDGDNNDSVTELAKMCINLKYDPPEYVLFSINKNTGVKGNVKVSTN